MCGAHNTRGRTGKPTKTEASQSNEGFLSKSWWLGIGVIVTGLAAIVATVLTLVTNDQHTAKSISRSPMLDEQGMVSLLIAGDDYAKLSEIIGRNPDVHYRLRSGNTMYQYNRTWEYIDLLVDSTGRVLSVGIYTKTTSFKPTLDAGGYSIKLNGPSIVDQASAVGAFGNCGGNMALYFFEEFPLAMANQQVSFSLGWVNSYLSVPSDACVATGTLVLSPKGCAKFNSAAWFSSQFMDCLNASGAGRRIAQLSPSVAIVTAPGRSLIPDMFTINPAAFTLLGPLASH